MQLPKRHQLGGRDVILGIRLGVANVEQTVVGAALNDPVGELLRGHVIDLRFHDVGELLGIQRDCASGRG